MSLKSKLCSFILFRIFLLNLISDSLQPYKYLHLLRLLEAGLSTRAQDYTRVLAEHICACVTGGLMVEQETVPGWVTNTQHLAEMLKYLVSEES